jgi:hypothetical protein
MVDTVKSGLLFTLPVVSWNINIPDCVEVPVSAPDTHKKLGAEGEAIAPQVKLVKKVPMFRVRFAVAGFVIVSHGGAVPVVIVWQPHVCVAVV